MATKNTEGPDRAIASYGALAAWGLGLFVAVRYLVGIPTLAGGIYYATPLAIPFLIALLPGVAIAAGLLLADLVARPSGASLLTPRQVEVLLWSWGIALLGFTGWWFLRASR